ncbi:Peroxiredoxin [Parasphingorhabdus marina DSM 22363]|uniref:thioredoxin-dependent peroxiredoxin n=1 Tax=Parasphingorhabdus marina DSM 22363 TaxID=1123272 RepID=A0A1N6F2J3_9SPHN|nr:peroxiredoxin family protein [Parasphingorhabdus marina]SIN89502.1 Peroxiredoxin [Parasphingorhabdus marina DSM 22363]
MTSIRSTVLAAASALALTACGTAETAPENGDAESAASQMPKAEPLGLEDLPTIDAGLTLGETAPLDSVFQTEDGQASLSEIVAKGPAVLVFTRSVEWCPFCQTQLKGINGIVSDLEQRGYTLYGVSYDSVESQNRFSKNQMLNYRMLSDESSAAIDAFGLRDPQYTEGKAVGVPYASVVVIDTSGKITAKSVSGDYRKRPTNEQVLAIVDSAS